MSFWSPHNKTETLKLRRVKTQLKASFGFGDSQDSEKGSSSVRAAGSVLPLSTFWCCHMIVHHMALDLLCLFHAGGVRVMAAALTVNAAMLI